MNIDYMFKKIIVRSGQFLIDTNNIELDPDRFRFLVEDALAIYSKFVPYNRHLYLDTATRRIQFTKEMIRQLTGVDYLNVPDWISDATPMRLYGVNPYYVFTNLQPYNNQYLVQKTQMPWEYRKPDMYLPISAEWDLLAVWKHRIIEKQNDDGSFTFDVPTLEAEDSEKFIKLLQGMFLQGIGRSRRAFTMGDLPIVMDGAEITSEGVEIEREAIEDLENVQKFYLAW